MPNFPTEVRVPGPEQSNTPKTAVDLQPKPVENARVIPDQDAEVARKEGLIAEREKLQRARALIQEQDPRFINTCRSMVSTTRNVSPESQERTVRVLSRYLPLLLQKLNIPVDAKVVSQIKAKVGEANWLEKRTIGRNAAGWARGRKARVSAEPFSGRGFEETAIHELTHALTANIDFGRGTLSPNFVAEGIAQAGESIVEVPYAEDAKKKLAEMPLGQRVRLANNLLNLKELPAYATFLHIPGAPRRLPMIRTGAGQIPEGANVYSNASGMFFRYLLEAEGPAKFRELGNLRNPFASRDSINRSMKKIYGQSLPELRNRAMRYWYGKEAADQAQRVNRVGSFCRDIAGKTFGVKAVKEVFVGNAVFKKGEGDWGEGRFTSLSLQLNSDSKTPSNHFFLIKEEPGGKFGEAFRVNQRYEPKKGWKLEESNRYPNIVNAIQGLAATRSK